MPASPRRPGDQSYDGLIISADLPVLAQLRPGQAVAFTFVSPAQAVRAARRQAAILQQIAARLL